MMKKRHTLSLYEFNLLVKEVLEHTFAKSYLITAEIASLNVDARGHCYMELVEKDEGGIRANASARIWASSYKLIKAEFENATGAALSKGLKILLEATLTFHERYGLSLIIKWIDPSYTLGEMARKKREILQRLEAEGILDRNKSLALPLVIQKIAVFSSKGAAGFEDFMRHLQSNPYGYIFHVTLYETVMQGDRVEESFVDSLRRSQALAEQIDVVVIVRGGGGAVELDAFNSYLIGRGIALLAIPVICGVGHERDRSVIDEVSHLSVKTPTAAAAFIIERTRAFEETLDSRLNELVLTVRERDSRLNTELITLSRTLEHGASAAILRGRYAIKSYSTSLYVTLKIVQRHRNHVTVLSEKFKTIAVGDLRALKAKLSYLRSRLELSLKQLVNRQQERLKMLTTSAANLNPENVLKRGYSITMGEGGLLIKTADQVREGMKLQTVLSSGQIESTVTGTISASAPIINTKEG
ncbi:MAG: exodeoxyribonuclease VII large subunit [Nitrospirae bacterium]|nr:exodeoxyribonuclease VII large subunit [Nitrospirota bacterium]MBF0534941.1 exodeoxyribonuclease VII large subunit [Nitrospirota bacterium]MBF0617208.1 exodeoxyribonuclease VII large subunit [Nitrospirota bacterium]